MKLIRPMVVQCEHCSEVIEVDTDLEYICSEERPKGEEIYYSAEIEDVCPICSMRINIKFNVYEYPMGAINYQEEQCEGAEILEKPEYDPFDNDDY